MRLRLLFALLCLILAGCATTPAQRIARDRAAYASWPPAVQARVKAGEIALGFTPAQVRMALGNPDRVYTRTTGQGAGDIWIYYSRKPRFSLGLGVGGGGGSTYVGGATMIGGGEGYHREAMRVIFADGRVSAVERTQ